MSMKLQIDDGPFPTMIQSIRFPLEALHVYQH